MFIKPNGAKAPSPAKSASKLSNQILLALIFLLMTVGLSVFFLKVDKTEYTTTVQRYVYSIGISGLLGGLLTFWVSQILRPASAQPVKRAWWFYPLVSGGIALAAMSLAYTYLGMWPIGERSAMIVDMHHQYAPLLADLRDMILNGGGNAFYSFHTGLGANFLPLFGYYLASPFNLLLVFFPEGLLTEGILFITLLKNALTAAAFAACVQYVYRRQNAAIPVAAVMYSMMMYLLAYSWNIMWLDCVMVLPLVVMGFEKLMRTGRYLPYVLTLAYALFANYYIGFMLCIFMVLYYIVYAARQARPIQAAGTGLARFAIGSALGGGLAMFLLIPVAIALGQTSAAGGTFPEELKINFDLFDLLGRHLYGASPTIRSGNLPNIYCGVLSVFLLPIFATTNTIPLRRRLSYLALWAVMALSLAIGQIDLVWHGLHAPNDLPYRFSFLYSFVLILIAYETLLHLKEVRFKQAIGALVALVAYLVIEERFGKAADDGGYSAETIYISLFLLLAYALITVLVTRKKIRIATAYALLLVVVVGEMTMQGGTTYRTLNSDELFTKHENYVDNSETLAIRAAVDKMQTYGDAHANGAFYRMEFTPTRTCMAPSLFHYRGMSVFSSSYSYNTTKFMDGIGYATNGVNSHLYRGFVAPVDSLLGIRYVAIKDVNMTSHPQLRKIDSVKLDDKSYYIYENTTALPVGFLVQSSVKDWTSTKYNPLYSQNALFTAMTGIRDDLYTFEKIEATPGSAHLATTSGTTRFSIKTSSEAKAIFEATITEAQQVFLYVDCGAADKISAEVHRDGSTLDDLSWTLSAREPYIVDAGNLKAGDVVRVTVETDSAASGNVYVAGLDAEVFEQNFEKLQAGGLQVSSFTGNSIKGTLTAAEAGTVFMSIPYDAGWSVKVDGKRVDTFGIGQKDVEDPEDGAMLGFDVGVGTHTIELVFVPKGLIPGVLISLVSLALLILLVRYQRQNQSNGKKGKKSTLFTDVDAVVPLVPTKRGTRPAPPPEEPAADDEENG